MRKILVSIPFRGFRRAEPVCKTGGTLRSVSIPFRGFRRAEDMQLINLTPHAMFQSPSEVSDVLRENAWDSHRNGMFQSPSEVSDVLSETG